MIPQQIATGLICLLGLMALTPVVLRADELWGTVQGQVVVDGLVPILPPRAAAEDLCPSDAVPDDSLIVDARTGGLCYVAVFVKSRPSQIHPDLLSPPQKVVTQHIRNCRFVPHMLVLRTGQQLRVDSQDPLPHLARFAGFNNTSEGTSTNNWQEFQLPQPERLPVRASCAFHPYMCGWWLVVDHPYATMTDVEGRFALPNLPVGKHELVLWHERTGYLEKSLLIDVNVGENELPARRYSADRFLDQTNREVGGE